MSMTRIHNCPQFSDCPPLAPEPSSSAVKSCCNLFRDNYLLFALAHAHVPLLRMARPELADGR